MFPWFLFWAPHFNPTLHFPWSGALRQDIAPETDWFFGQIRAGTGDAETEREVFRNVASYGKQIGILSDVVSALIEAAPAAVQDNAAVAQLKSIRVRVDTIKDKRGQSRIDDARALIEKLQREAPQAFTDLMSEFSAAGSAQALGAQPQGAGKPRPRRPRPRVSESAQ